jgi:phosphopantothenoylcysteine decarboxylase/phosphopantothenate--cysteine ligase
MGHIELARWADLILVAPASANFIARLAGGEGSDLLSTLCLATDAPIALAPAMNQSMWRDARTQVNVGKLTDHGIHLFGPGNGEQACGDVGPGRMLEPEQLSEFAANLFQSERLSGLKVVITAGPTREAIDPVRYISNHSSGKMGYALAEAAVEAGALVTLISGPVNLQTPDRVQRINIISAEELLEASMANLPDCDIFIAAAAVADYRPIEVPSQKIKKSTPQIRIELTRNPDIVATVAAQEPKPFTVGFAAETQNLLDYARNKLTRKNLDLIIANDVSQQGIGFNSDDNAVTVVDHAQARALKQGSKRSLARQLIEIIAEAQAQHTAKSKP